MREKVSVFCRKCFVRAGKIVLRVLRSIFGENHLFANKNFFFIKLGHFRLENVFLRGCQKCNFRVHLNVLMKCVSFWEEGFFWSFWCFFDTRPKMIRRNCQNGMVRVYENTLREVFSRSTIVFATISDLEPKVFGDFRNVFDAVHKTALCVGGGFIWGKSSSLKDKQDFFIISFRILLETFQAFCQVLFGTVVKIISCVFRHNSRKSIYF